MDACCQFWTKSALLLNSLKVQAYTFTGFSSAVFNIFLILHSEISNKGAVT